MSTSGSNPRKFKDRIARLAQKQAEDTAQFQEVMREVAEVKKPVHLPGLVGGNIMTGFPQTSSASSSNLSGTGPPTGPNLLTASASSGNLPLVLNHHHHAQGQQSSVQPVNGGMMIPNTGVRHLSPIQHQQLTSQSSYRLYSGSLPNMNAVVTQQSEMQLGQIEGLAMFGPGPPSAIAVPGAGVPCYTPVSDAATAAATSPLPPLSSGMSGGGVAPPIFTSLNNVPAAAATSTHGNVNSGSMGVLYDGLAAGNSNRLTGNSDRCSGSGGGAIRHRSGERRQWETSPYGVGSRPDVASSAAGSACYSSSLSTYLSPPPESRWRRTSSDSALYQSVKAPGAGGGGSGGSSPSNNNNNSNNINIGANVVQHQQQFLLQQHQGGQQLLLLDGGNNLQQVTQYPNHMASHHHQQQRMASTNGGCRPQTGRSRCSGSLSEAVSSDEGSPGVGGNNSSSNTSPLTAVCPPLFGGVPAGGTGSQLSSIMLPNAGNGATVITTAGGNGGPDSFDDVKPSSDYLAQLFSTASAATVAGSSLQMTGGGVMTSTAPSAVGGDRQQAQPITDQVMMDVKVKQEPGEQTNHGVQVGSRMVDDAVNSMASSSYQQKPVDSQYRSPNSPCSPCSPALGSDMVGGGSPTYQTSYPSTPQQTAAELEGGFQRFRLEGGAGQQPPTAMTGLETLTGGPQQQGPASPHTPTSALPGFLITDWDHPVCKDDIEADFVEALREGLEPIDEQVFATLTGQNTFVDPVVEEQFKMNY